MPPLFLLLLLPLVLLQVIMADLIGSVGNLITGGINDAKNLATRVWHAVHAVWSFITKIFTLVGGAWSEMLTGVVNIGKALWDGSVAVYDAIKWTLTVAIPHAVTAAITGAAKLAGGALAKVERALRGVINTVAKDVRSTVSKLTGWLRSTVRGIERDIAGATKWITKTGAQVAGLVLHPDRMAKWIVKDLLDPLVHLFLSGSRDLLVALIRGFKAESAEVGHMLEEVLSKIL